jgi:glycolate oxidase
MIGHAGDGNVHPVILYDGTDIHAVNKASRAAHDVISAALEIGGTITGEHGVGSEKIPFMRDHLRPAEIAAMRVVKHAFDPTGILNPGIMFPESTSDEPSLPLLTTTMRVVIANRQNNKEIDILEAIQPKTAQTQESREDDIQLDTENLTVNVQANVSIQKLQNRLTDAGYYCSALQHIHNEEQFVSVHTLLSLPRYRAAVRNTLLEVDVTLADGIPARFGSNVVKDVAGYDMKRLFIGSNSLFGMVKKARFQIRHR